MRDTFRLCLAIVGAVLTVYFSLHVLRFVAISAETRGICAGVVGYLVGSQLWDIRWGRRERSRRRR